jgi:hypothetical protein
MIILKNNLLDEDEMINEKANSIHFIILSSTLLFNLGALIVLGLQTFIAANKIEWKNATADRGSPCLLPHKYYRKQAGKKGSEYHYQGSKG